MGDSYYELLGVSPDAPTEAIQRAYREKLKETHPDVSDDEDASERTKRLIEAKEVLTDEDERARYDRLGHENYVSAGSDVGATAATATQSADDSTAAASDGGNATGRRRDRNRDRRVRDESWYGSGGSWRSDRADAAGADATDSWRVWNTDGSFAVRRDGDSYQHGRMFASERALILLLSTFVVYPVLLFGALFPEFPLAINFTVAMCVVMVIAFLQSIPEVGIAVFGIWSVLLPVGMFVVGLDVVSIRGFLAMIAVVFPLGLSVLTRIAIRPVTAG